MRHARTEGGMNWRREVERIFWSGLAKVIAITMGLLAAMAILFCRGG